MRGSKPCATIALHDECIPAVQASQAPQGLAGSATSRSPTLQPVTPGPTSTTVPAYS